jgi:hypothetical protein
MSFWDTFTRLCAEKGTTPEEVAAALDLPPTCLIEFRYGAFPAGELQRRIADHLGVPAASLGNHEPIEPPCRIRARKLN